LKGFEYKTTHLSSKLSEPAQMTNITEDDADHIDSGIITRPIATNNKRQKQEKTGQRSQ
jgi:hypothetical protein